MATYHEEPLWSDEPTIPARQGLNKPLIYGGLIGGGVLLFILAVWAVSVWLMPSPPPPPPAVASEAPGLTKAAPPLESLTQEPLPTSFANLDRRPPETPPPPLFQPQVAAAPTCPAPYIGTPPHCQCPPGTVPPTCTPPGAQTTPAHAAPHEAPKAPKKPEWGFLATGTGRTTTTTPKPEETAPPPKGSHLIDAASWAKPAKKERTIYRSQVLPCEVLQTINSNAPGQIQLRLTVPVYGYYGQGEELFPKDSKIVAVPAGKPDYGDRTLAVKLEQAHLPDGTIVEIPGDLGNEDGSSGGLKGKVNNHWIPLIGATAINALVNLGGGYLVGTPGRGEHYLDPAQRAMDDAVRSVQGDVKSTVNRELRRGPTITRDPKRPGERFCTIQMLKNIQFGDSPPIIK